MIVLDASAAVELLLTSALGEEVASRISDAKCSLHAPHLLDVEVAQALRRCAEAGTISSRRGRAALERMTDLGIERYEHGALLPRAWKLRRNLTVYDAVYVALAETLDAPLLTCDLRLARAPGHQATVELVAR